MVTDAEGNLALKTTLCDAESTPNLNFVLSGTAATYATLSINGGAPLTMIKTSTGKNQSNWKYTWTPDAPIDLSALTSVVATYNGKEIGSLTIGSGCLGRTVQIAAAGKTTCLLTRTGDLKCWGNNNNGQLGQGDTNNRGDNPDEMSALAPINLGTGLKAKGMALGEFHVCAIIDDGRVKCWGSNGYGQLGIEAGGNRGGSPDQMGDNLPFVNLGTGRTAKALTAGDNFTCALLDNGSVKCWGINGFGQLGVGDTSNRGASAGQMGDFLPAVDLGTGKTAKAIDSGALHTCALLNDNSVKCWGWNYSGELGIGNTTAKGDNAGEMGDSLMAVDLGTGRTAKAIAGGYMHVCAILDNNALKCWGYNVYGQLGLGNTANRGDNPNEMGDYLPTVFLGWASLVAERYATSIALGYLHTCALLDNGGLKCWGSNELGQLGLGDTNDRGDNASEMSDLPEVSFAPSR